MEFFFHFFRWINVRAAQQASLTVKAKVFGKGLRAEHLEAHGDKVAHGPGVLLQAARGEALIGRVEEDKQLPPLVVEEESRSDEALVDWLSRATAANYHHDFSDLLPLLLSWIGAGRVVSAGVQDEDGTLRTALGEGGAAQMRPTDDDRSDSADSLLLPPSPPGTRSGPGPSSRRPSTCMDGRLQSRRWQTLHCDFLEEKFFFRPFNIFCYNL